MKKVLFTVMNYWMPLQPAKELPQRNVHCRFLHFPTLGQTIMSQSLVNLLCCSFCRSRYWSCLKATRWPCASNLEPLLQWGLLLATQPKSRMIELVVVLVDNGHVTLQLSRFRISQGVIEARPRQAGPMKDFVASAQCPTEKSMAHVSRLGMTVRTLTSQCGGQHLRTGQ